MPSGKKILFLSFIIPALSAIIILFLKLQENILSFDADSILFAYIITTINYSLGLISIKIGINKSAKIFLISFLGGMVFRLFLMLALILISLNSLQIKQNSFIFSVFIFYSFYLFTEIFYLNKRKN